MTTDDYSGYSLLPDPSPRSSVAARLDDDPPLSSQAQQPPRLAPLSSLTLVPLPGPLSTFPLPPTALSALLPASPLFMLTTTEARGSVHPHILSLRVHPASLVSSLTFRLVCLHAPLLLKPSLQLRVQARMATARREAAMLAEALWLEEDREGRCEEEVRQTGGPSSVSESVRRRAEVAARHRRWRSEARRSGRVVELCRRMLSTGAIEQADRFHSILAHLDAPDQLSSTAARDEQGGGIGGGVLEQRQRRSLAVTATADAAADAAARATSSPSRIVLHRMEQTIDVELLVEEALYSGRHVQLSQLKDAVEALPSQTEPASSSPAALTASSPSLPANSSSASVAPLTSSSAPSSSSPPSSSASAAASSSSSPYSGVSSGCSSYVSFTPRAWCDGAYLRSSLSLSSSHLTHHSTVYLMFECPYATARQHHREAVYAAGADRRGFAVFVRHPQSRSLLRVVVHLSTRVWRVKAVAVRHCFDWDEEGLQRLDDEVKHRKSGEQQPQSTKGQQPRPSFDLTGDDDDEEEAARPSSSPSDRCALLHHGRVCFDDDSLTFSGVGPGDVLTLLDKQSPLDASIDSARYSSPHWYPSRLCKHPVRRSTVFDVQALLAQLREVVDEIVYRPQHVHRLKEAFKRLDPHHSGQLNEQEVAISGHTILNLLQRRLAAGDAQRSRLWLVPMEDASGRSEVGEVGVGFEEPSFLPTDQATSFAHFLRLLADGLVELMRARQVDLIHPGQPFVKPSWWLQDHLSADNHRLLHTVLSTLPDLAVHRDEAVRAGGEWTAAHMQTFLGRVGLSSAHSAAASGEAAGGAPTAARGSADVERGQLEDAYVLSQVLKAEQERQLVERETHNFHRGFTFSARRRHDAALSGFLHHLERCLAEDFELDEAEQAPQHLASYVHTGALTVLRFLLRPLLLFLDLSGKIWAQREPGRSGWLSWLWSMALLSLYIAALAGFFYIPFLLVAVYFVYCEHSGSSKVSVLEAVLPLATTCLLIAYQVNGAVSAQLLSLENDEQRMSEAQEESRLLCLQMRASPVLLDYDGKEEAKRKAERKERERLLALTSEVGHVLQAASDAGGSGQGMETLFVQGRKQQPAHATEDDQRPSLSVSANELGRAATLAQTGEHARAAELLPPPQPQPPNAVGAGKARRLQMSQAVLSWRLGPDKGQGDLLLQHKLLFLLLAILHTVVPGAYRVHSGSPFFGSTWSDQLVSGGAWVCIPAVYLFLVNLGRACMGYHQLAVRLHSVTLLADAGAAFESKLPYFLDLRQPNCLEYWLALREKAKQVDEQLLGMVAGAVMMLGLLLVVAVIRVLFYHEGADLFNVLSIFDVVLYSAFVFTFLLIVVQANTVLSVEHLQLIQRIRHQLSLDVCNGVEWHGLTAGLDEEERRPMDTWSELDTFEAEDEEVVEQEAAQMQRDVQDGGAFTSRRTQQPSPSSSKGPSRRGSQKAGLPLLCPHQLVPFECMTCALQSHASSLHARHSARLQSVTSLLSSLHSTSLHHASHDRVSIGYFRFAVGAQLLDSTIAHITSLDEPVRLLGLEVNQQLLMQAVAAIVTGAASALSSLVPSSST